MEEVSDEITKSLKHSVAIRTGELQANLEWQEDGKFATEIWAKTSSAYSDKTYHAMYYLVRGYPGRARQVTNALKAGQKAVQNFKKS